MNFNLYKRGGYSSIDLFPIVYKKSIPLFLGLFLTFLTPSVLEAQQVTLDKGVDLTSAQSGQNLKYSLDWGCSSLTADCINAQLIDQLPLGVEFISATSAIVPSTSGTVIVPGVYDAATRTVTWDFKTLVLPEGGIPDGASGTVEIIVKIVSGIIPTGAVLTNSASIPSANAGTATDGATTTITGSSPKWTVTKTVISGPIYHDNPVKYQVRLCSDGTIGNLHLLPASSISDALPLGAVFLSATGGGTHDGGTPGVVTWNFTDTLKVTDACRTMIVTVKYPYSDQVNNNTGLTTNIPKTNTATLTATAIGNIPVNKNGSANDPLLPPHFEVDVVKTKPDVGAVPIGTDYKYIIEPKNKSTTSVNNFVLTDDLPNQFDLTKVKILPFDHDVPLTIKVEINNSGTYIDWQTNVSTASTTTFDVATIPGFTQGGADYISSIKFDFGNNVPPGLDTGRIELIVTPSYPNDNIGNPTLLNIPFKNTATVDAINPFNMEALQADSSVNVCIVETGLSRIDPAKEVAINYVTTPPGVPTQGNPYFKGARVKYSLYLDNTGNDTGDGDVSGSASMVDMVNPVASDLLPSGMLYESGSWTICENTTGLTFDNSGTNPIFETVPNFNGTGKDLLRWKFAGNFPPGTYVKVCFNAFIKNTNAAGAVITNTYALSAENNIYCDGNDCGTATTVGINDYFGTVADPSVLLSNINKYCMTSVDLTVADTISVPTPTKSIISSGPYAPTESAPVEAGISTDTVQYKIGICNSPTANFTLPDPTLIDLMPAEMELVAGSIQLSANTSGLTLDGANPAFTTSPNFNGSGRQLMRWKFTGEIPIGACIEYTYKALIKLGAGGVKKNEPFGVAGIRQYQCAYGSVIDNNDLDGDGNIGETVCKASYDPDITIPEIKSMGAKKFVKGAKDASYLGSDLGKLGIGGTYPSDSVLWRMKVINSGNVTLTDAQVVDIFPFPGDVGVQLNTTPRESKWTPYLVAPIIAPDPNITVFYSQSTNPCRSEISPVDPSSCVNDWSSTPPSNLATVKAVKFDFSNKDLLPAETFWFDIKMLAPDSVGMVPGIAWNSVARDAVEIPAQEPNKVGILISGFDMALKKTLSAGQTYNNVRPDTDVNFDITVVNQSTDTVKNVVVNDYIPPTMTLNDGDWTSLSASKAAYTLAGPFAPGATSTVQITLHVNSSAPIGSSDNFSEIAQFEDKDGNIRKDWDSFNDSDNSNDTGGQPLSAADDYLLGSGNGTIGDGVAATDEDDHDPAQIKICRIAATTIPTNAICYAGNGSLDLTVTEATGATTFAWSNGATTEDINSILAGTYSVTITDSEGCQATASGTVTQPPAIAVTAPTINAVSCKNGNDGNITISISNAVLPTSVLWSNGATTETISNLIAGSYTVTVTDANACLGSATFTVTEPTALSINSVTDLTCAPNSGVLNLSVTGGTPNYIYLWSNGATTEDLSGVTGGTYFVTVTDANGCTAQSSGIVVEPIPLNASATATAALCYGANGTINLTASDGTPNYTYSWSNGATTEDIFAIAGTYTATITDIKGCTTTAVATITQPNDLTLSGVPTMPLCFGGNNGSIDLTISGGIPNYTYLWSNGAITQDISGLSVGNYTVTVTDANSCAKEIIVTVNQPTQTQLTPTPISVLCKNGTGSINLTASGGTGSLGFLWSNGATTEDISGITAGAYSVTTTDANGCAANTTTTVTEPDLLTASAAATDALCKFANGSIALTVIGGTPNYTYLWSNNATSKDLSATAGTYTVTITDANGCTTTAQATINEPATAINTSITGIDETCGNSNASVNLTASGGTGTLTFLWSNGAITEDISNLSAGSYTVTATDANGCTDTKTKILTAVALPTAAITASETSGKTNDCKILSGTTVSFTATGGTSYAWSDGLGNASTATATPSVTTTYTVTITDANGCTDTETKEIFVKTPPSVSISLSETSCTANDGQIMAGQSADLTANAAGGTPAYTYRWDNGLNANNVQTVTPSLTTTYNVTVSDSDGFTATASSTITLVPTPTLTVGAATCQASLTKYDVAISSTGGAVSTTIGTISGGSVIDIPIASNVTITVAAPATGCSVNQTVQAPNCSCPIVNAPTAIATSNQSICQGQTIPALSALVGSGETIDWYNASSGGTLLLSNSPSYTPSMAGTFYAQTRNTTSDCVSSTRTSTSLTINIPPSVSATNITICNTSISLIHLPSLLTSAVVGGVWTRQSGTGGSFDAGAGTFTPSTGTTTSVFRHTLTTPSCPDTTTDVTITVQNCCPSNNCGTISISKN